MSEYVDMPFFCIISYSRLDTFDTFKHGSFYLLYIFIISSFSTMAAKILLSHRRSWTAYRGFLRRIRSLSWRFRRGWGKIESIKCLNASHKALLLCGTYKKRVTLFDFSKHNPTCLGNTKTPPAALSSDNKKSHDGQCPSRRVTGRGDGTLNSGFKPAFRPK